MWGQEQKFVDGVVYLSFEVCFVVLGEALSLDDLSVPKCLRWPGQRCYRYLDLETGLVRAFHEQSLLADRAARLLP